MVVTGTNISHLQGKSGSKRQRSFEEREEDYEKARARIFTAQDVSPTSSLETAKAFRAKKSFRAKIFSFSFRSFECFYIRAGGIALVWISELVA